MNSPLPYIARLVGMLALIVGVGVLYGYTPDTQEVVRKALAAVQFLLMAILMLDSLYRILREF